MYAPIKIVHKQTVSGFAALNKGLRMTKYSGAKDSYTVKLDKITGLIKTGLTPEQEEEFEVKLGFPKGHLKPSSDFWVEFFIYIPEEGLMLDRNEPMHELYYTVFSKDPLFSLTPEAAKLNNNCKYIMYDEESKAKESNSKRKDKLDAFKLFATLTKTNIIDILFVYGFSADDTSPEVNENRLYDIMEKNPTNFLNIASDKDLTLKTFIHKAVRAGIITKSGTSAGMDVPMLYRETTLGTGLDEVCKFLKNKEYQNIFVAIKKELDDYKRNS